MRTYQDMLTAQSEQAKRGFIKDAIREFKASAEYRLAVQGEAYYNKHNTTIERFQKVLYTVSGKKVPDYFSSNYKLKTLFFRRLVTQQVQYVLGNGVTLQDPAHKDALGKSFDFELQKCAKRAMAEGRAFGFWNFDHLEVFGFADTPNEAGFCPLYDEKTAQLRAGIRFWHKRLGNSILTRCTLYEEDGYTEYSCLDNEDLEVVEPKRAYKRTITSTIAGGVEKVIEVNYARLPIIPLYANDTKESELVGIRESIDCYDLIKSGLANDIDDANGFYWILKNTGGMDDIDLAQFVQRMKTVKAQVVDGDDGVDAQAHTLDIPTEARSAMLELLRKDIYEDFQALDVNTLSASAKTTQEIQASYQSQDNKCADFEYYIIDFVQKILDLAGIDDIPSFVWNRVVNQAEQTSMILMSANYLTDEAIIRHLPFLTPEEANEIIEQRNTESLDRWTEEDDIDGDGQTDGHTPTEVGEEV